MEIRESFLHKARITVILIIFFVGSIWLARSLKVALNSAEDADIFRIWVIGRYVQARINPYAVTLQIIEDKFKSNQECSRIRLHATPRGVFNANMLQSLPPSEATYPPFAEFILSFTKGLLPKNLVIPFWCGINLLVLIFLPLTLVNIKSRRKLSFFFIVLSILLIWSPTQYTIERSQFGLIVALLIILACKDMKKIQLEQLFI